MTGSTTFTWKGRAGPFDLELSDSTFQPSTISTLLADAIDLGGGEVVIDLGCGSGVLAIVAARLGAGHVHGIDSAPDVVAVAGANARRAGVADRVTFYHGDLFDPLPAEVKADLVIGDVSGIPDALAEESGWFPGKMGGGPRGSELPIRMLEAARRFLKPGGRLLLPTGSLQDESAILDRARDLYGRVTKLIERNIPLPGALAESGTVRKLIQDGIVRLSQRGSRFVWTARVWESAPSV